MKDEIINFDSRNITPEIHDSVSELLAQKANSFEHNTIYRVSVAAAPLAAWVKANLEYAVVLKKVGPMMQENGETRRHYHRIASQLHTATSPPPPPSVQPRSRPSSTRRRSGSLSASASSRGSTRRWPSSRPTSKSGRPRRRR